MQINADVSFRFHTPPRKPSGVDSLCGVATLLFKVPREPYIGAPATGLTNLLNEVAPHGMHAACDLSTPEAFLPEPNARAAEHSYHLLSWLIWSSDSFRLRFCWRNSGSLSRSTSYDVPSTKRRVIRAMRHPKRSAVSISPILGASSSALVCSGATAPIVTAAHPDHAHLHGKDH